MSYSYASKCLFFLHFCQIVPGDTGDRSFQSCGVEGSSSSAGVRVPLQPSSKDQCVLMGVVRWVLIGDGPSEELSRGGVEGKKYKSPPLGPSKPSIVGEDGVRSPVAF